MEELETLRSQVMALRALCLALAQTQAHRDVLKTALEAHWQTELVALMDGPVITEAAVTAVAALEARIAETIGPWRPGDRALSAQ